MRVSQNPVPQSYAQIPRGMRIESLKPLESFFRVNWQAIRMPLCSLSAGEQPNQHCQQHRSKSRAPWRWPAVCAGERGPHVSFEFVSSAFSYILDLRITGGSPVLFILKYEIAFQGVAGTGAFSFWRCGSASHAAWPQAADRAETWVQPDRWPPLLRSRN